MNLEIGTRYRLRYRSETQRRDRTAVMDYIGTNHNGDHQFSARPVAGTQTMPAAWLLEAVAVAKATPVHLNRVVRS